MGVLALVLFLSPCAKVEAAKLTDEQLHLHSLYSIFFYDGDEEKCGSGVGAGNYNYAGATVWSEAELEAISANQAVYEEAASEYGFPWQILAVIHSSETALRRYNPANGQGVYQMFSYTGGGTNENRFEPASEISEEEFLRQTKLAAEFINRISGGSLESEGEIKRLFFRYNGTSGQYIQKALALGFSQEEAENGEGSPYVMNRYDALRDPTSASMNPVWAGRYVRDGQYDAGSTSTFFGAFVKFEALSGSSGICSVAGGSIAETAILLSWGEHNHGKFDPKPEYVEAMEEVGGYITPCNGSGCAPIGASCDQFVGTVMRYSGADAEFPIFGPGVQEEHMVAHPEMYEKVETSDVSDLLPGDIFVTTENGRHIYLYVGEIDGVPSQASASFNDRTGEHFAGVYFSDHASAGVRHYNVYRRINV